MRFFLLFSCLILCALSPVQSPVKSAVHSAVIDNGIPYVTTEPQLFLDSVISSIAFDLDASFHDGTAIWANKISSPADGSAQTDFDFYLGLNAAVEGDEPTLTEGTHFLFDGGDLMASVQRALNAPTLWKDMHKTTGGTDYWLAIAFFHPSLTLNSSMFETWSDNGSKGSGMAFQGLTSTTPDRVHTLHKNGSQQAVNVDGFLAQTDQLIIVSFDTSTETQRMWINSNTAIENDASIYNGGSADGECNPCTIGALSTLAPFMPNGTKIYGFYGGNEYLDDTKAGNISAHLETRHGINYVP